MRYRVTGHDEHTRKPIELTIDAETEPAAWRDAKSRGLIIKSVEPAPDARRPLDASPHSEPVTVRIEPGHVQLIELTAKPWKALFALSLLVLTLGLAWGTWSLLRTPRTLAHPPLTAWLGGAVTLLGLLGLLIARLGAWWRHG